jgi:hypothetical protein
MREPQGGPELRLDKVQLGCWTLIPIAIIVAVFSGHGEID